MPAVVFGWGRNPVPTDDFIIPDVALCDKCHVRQVGGPVRTRRRECRQLSLRDQPVHRRIELDGDVDIAAEDRGGEIS